MMIGQHLRHENILQPHEHQPLLLPELDHFMRHLKIKIKDLPGAMTFRRPAWSNDKIKDNHALCLKNNQPLSFTLCSLYNVWSWESISRMIFASCDSSPVWPKWTLWRRILLKLMKYSISSNLSLPNSGLHGKAPANYWYPQPNCP